MNDKIIRLADDVYGWVENETSIMLKAVTAHGDPVELTAEEAKDVATALLNMAEQLERS